MPIGRVDARCREGSRADFLRHRALRLMGLVRSLRVRGTTSLSDPSDFYRLTILRHSQRRIVPDQRVRLSWLFLRNRPSRRIASGTIRLHVLSPKVQ